MSRATNWLIPSRFNKDPQWARRRYLEQRKRERDEREIDATLTARGLRYLAWWAGMRYGSASDAGEFLSISERDGILSAIDAADGLKWYVLTIARERKITAREAWHAIRRETAQGNPGPRGLYGFPNLVERFLDVSDH